MDKLSKVELTQYTTQWCRKYGIKPRDLGCGINKHEDGTYRINQNAHPAIDDVMILIKLRDEFWSVWNSSERGVWAAYWSSVYHNGCPFKKKALKKIETIANSGIYRQQQAELNKQKIKQLRIGTSC